MLVWGFGMLIVSGRGLDFGSMLKGGSGEIVCPRLLDFPSLSVIVRKTFSMVAGALPLL